MKIPVCAFAFSIVASAALAEEPLRLDDTQMDSVVAGNALKKPGGQSISFSDLSSGSGPLQVTGVEMVMPGDNVSSVVGDAVDAFLKAKKAFAKPQKKL